MMMPAGNGMMHAGGSGDYAAMLAQQQVGGRDSCCSRCEPHSCAMGRFISNGGTACLAYIYSPHSLPRLPPLHPCRRCSSR